MRVFIATLGLSVTLCSSLSAEMLTKTIDHRGSVHFGTTEFPNKCCHCHIAIEQTELGYITESGSTLYVGTKRYFVNGSDERTWVCPPLGADETDVVIPTCVITSGTS